MFDNCATRKRAESLRGEVAGFCSRVDPDSVPLGEVTGLHAAVLDMRRRLQGLESLRADGLVDGETCEIAGVGPVPVPVVRSMLADAFLATVVTDGVDVYNVTHHGRTVTAHQRTALEARGYLPHFEVLGGCCGTDVRHVRAIAAACLAGS